MPVIGAGAGIPGTNVGLGVKLGFRSGREKEADAATRIGEQAERDRTAESAARPQDTPLDALVRSDALERFR